MNTVLLKKISAIFMLLFIVNADMVNITVDDMDAAILYQPPGAWSPGQSCRICVANVDKDLAYQSTWHDNTYYPDKNQVIDAEFNFTGPAVYVYCILSNSLDGITAGASDLSFFVDGELSNEFYREADPQGPKFVYNASVFANTSLADGEHRLIVRNGRPDRGMSIALLDRIVYTQNQDLTRPPNGHHNTKVGRIIGGVLGGLGCLLLAACASWMWFRRRQSRRCHVSHISPLHLTAPETLTESDPPAYSEVHIERGKGRVRS